MNTDFVEQRSMTVIERLLIYGAVAGIAFVLMCAISFPIALNAASTYDALYSPDELKADLTTKELSEYQLLQAQLSDYSIDEIITMLNDYSSNLKNGSDYDRAKINLLQNYLLVEGIDDEKILGVNPKYDPVNEALLISGVIFMMAVLIGELVYAKIIKPINTMTNSDRT